MVKNYNKSKVAILNNILINCNSLLKMRQIRLLITINLFKAKNNMRKLYCLKLETWICQFNRCSRNRRKMRNKMHWIKTWMLLLTKRLLRTILTRLISFRIKLNSKCLHYKILHLLFKVFQTNKTCNIRYLKMLL